MSGPHGPGEALVSEDEEEAHHARQITSLTRRLAGARLVVDDELRLDEGLSAHLWSDPTSRLVFLVPEAPGVPASVGFVTVVTEPGAGTRFGASSLRTRLLVPHIGVRRGEVVLGVAINGLTVVTSAGDPRGARFEAATNSEVTRCRSLLAALGPPLATEATEELDRLLGGAASAPEVASRSDVLAATAALTALATGVPLVWAVRRATTTT